MAHPRHRVFGYLSYAKQLAYQTNNVQQIIRVIYNEAWTAFWWFDDVDELNRRYDEIEPLCLKSIYISDLEHLHNLWQLMYTFVRRDLLKIDKKKPSKRTHNLLQLIEAFATNESKPNTALHARTIMHLTKLLLGATEKSDIVREELTRLKMCFKEIDGLASYPVLSFIEVLAEIGNSFSDYVEYDDIMEDLCIIAAKREGEVQEGTLLFQRGIQKLEKRKYLEALKLLGRAREKFVKDEAQAEMVQTAIACGVVYEAMGLLWAARMEVLVAASIALSKLDSQGIIPHIALTCTQRMIWLELQFGRIPCVLEWYRLSVALARALELDDEEDVAFENQRALQDAVLGILMLRLKPEELIHFEILPAILDELQLFSASAALLYGLGHEEVLREEGLFTSQDSKSDVLNFFVRLRDQPASSDLPDKPIFHAQRQTLYVTILMGCRVEISVQNSFDCLSLAENILAVLEAFLATIDYSDFAFYRPSLRITIEQSEYVSFPGYAWINEAITGKAVEIRINNSTSYYRDLMVRSQAEFRDWLVEILSLVLGAATIPRDSNVENPLEKLAKEGAFSRALSFSPTSIWLNNVLGDKPKYAISAWTKPEDQKVYHLKRREAWDISVPVLSNQIQDDTKDLSSKFTYDRNVIKHKDHLVLSHVNIDLWNKAKWGGTGFIYVPDGSDEPMLGVIFGDYEIGKQIFREWQQSIGEVDEFEELRVSIIQDIEPNSPKYKVVIGTEVDNVLKRRGQEHTATTKMFVMMSRINTMEPDPNSKYLENFKRLYGIHGCYRIIPCGNFNGRAFDFAPELSILKKKIHFRDLKDITQNDLDIVALRDV